MRASLSCRVNCFGARLRRLRDVGRRRQGLPRNRPEVPLRQAPHLGGGRVADDHQHGVVRRVVGLEEAAHVVERGGLELGEVAVEIVRVVPVGIGALPHLEPLEPAVRLVEHVDPHLLAHHVLLVLQVLLADVQRPHAIGLQPDGALERIHGQGLEVVRVVEARRTIHDAARLLHQRDVLHLLHLRRALEHHVLEQVREAGPALRLHAEADVVDDFHQGHRRGVVFADHHLQPVGQREVVHRDFEGLRRRRRGAS